MRAFDRIIGLSYKRYPWTPRRQNVPHGRQGESIRPKRLDDRRCRESKTAAREHHGRVRIRLTANTGTQVYMDLDAVGRAKANVQQLLASASATLNVLGPGCITTAFLGATPVPTCLPSQAFSPATGPLCEPRRYLGRHLSTI